MRPTAPDQGPETREKNPALLEVDLARALVDRRRRAFRRRDDASAGARELRLAFSLRAPAEDDGSSAKGGGPRCVLFGPSGAGKTSLLRCLAGLDKPDEGIVSVGEDVWVDTRRGVFLPPAARRVAYLSQTPALFPHLDVAANIAFSLSALPRGAREERVHALARALDLEGLLGRSPATLSGGEAQRVALARALARPPRLVLLDEPFAALDLPRRRHFARALVSLLDALGPRVPSVLVTHDPREAAFFARFVLVIENGRLSAAGPPEEVLPRDMLDF